MTEPGFITSWIIFRSTKTVTAKITTARIPKSIFEYWRVEKPKSRKDRIQNGSKTRMDWNFGMAKIQKGQNPKRMQIQNRSKLRICPKRVEIPNRWQFKNRQNSKRVKIQKGLKFRNIKKPKILNVLKFREGRNSEWVEIPNGPRKSLNPEWISKESKFRIYLDKVKIPNGL